VLVEVPELEALLRSFPFTRRLGMKVDELGDGTCTVKRP
jgi:hypothetical protein